MKERNIGGKGSLDELSLRPDCLEACNNLANLLPYLGRPSEAGQRLELADIMLDTVSYNGGATISNALWAGVPAIVKMGNHFVCRRSASALTAAGIPELITESLEEYRALAVRLAYEEEKLEGIQRRLVENRYTATLFDTEGFVRDIERAYRMMWEDAAASKSPRHIYVEHGDRDCDSGVGAGDRGRC